MYRVGFGDFFLVTVPSTGGPQHIVIDCGVTRGKTGKGDLASIKTAVRHMASETNNRLALIIVTHRHQDHIIGFSRCAAEFEQFRGNVDAAWMSYWETEYPKVEKLQADLESLALGLRAAALAGADDDINQEILGIAENASGVSSEGPGGGTNKGSLDFLKNKLGVKPDYYSKGDAARLPQSLVDAGLTATILGPPPANEFDFLKVMDLKQGSGQYLDVAGDRRQAKLSPFSADFIVDSTAYPTNAFREWAPRLPGVAPDLANRYASELEAAIRGATPQALLMAAKKLDNILNNQSLVVLFTWKGRRLLFAGDAKAGNWLYWLYDLDSPTKETGNLELSKEGREILASLDFYKAGHHGSTNATPIPAVEAMGRDFVTMCSTQAGTFGTVENDSEVPREPLMSSLAKRSSVIRSDHYAAKVAGTQIPAVEDAPAKPPKPTTGRVEVGDFWVDYFVPPK